MITHTERARELLAEAYAEQGEPTSARMIRLGDEGEGDKIAMHAIEAALRTHPSQPGVREATELLRDAQYHLRVDAGAEQWNERCNAFLAALSLPSQSAGQAADLANRLLAIIGFYRDDWKPEAVAYLQGIADELRALAAPSHIEGEADEDTLILRMLYELHAHMPEIERPMSMSDLSDEQTARARKAVRAIRAGEREILERAAKVAEATKLPAHYQWSRANHEKFEFGAKEAAKAIRSLSSQPEQDELG